jgi:hypothetical protein
MRVYEKDYRSFYGWGGVGSKPSPSLFKPGSFE